MLMKADIMLLDEPTNHLDVTNVAWLEGYLNGLASVTSIIVSHDSGFLDRVCTNIIHYEDLKLRIYKVGAPMPYQLSVCLRSDGNPTSARGVTVLTLARGFVHTRASTIPGAAP